jgi:uncharacterized SAM-binding protein YcdF (DUF218 family)
MFFVLSKIFDFIITPVCWVFALFLIGLIVKRQPLKKRFLISAFVVFYVFSNDFVANEFIVRWEIPATEDTAIHGTYDVAIVLGGITNYDDRMQRIQFEHGGDRLFQALRLYKQGKVKKIFLSGGSGNLDSHDIEAPLLRKYLLDIGIPDSVIVAESRSRNTHENAVFAKPILDSLAPNGRYLLVTSGYHLRRAMACFTKAGIKALPYSTDRIGGPLKWRLDYLLIPDIHSFVAWSTLLHEYFGYLTYKVAGYL